MENKYFFHFEIIINVLVRGFLKLEKIKKSEKNSEVVGWVKPQLGFFFGGGGGILWGFFFFLLYMFPKSLKIG